MTTNDDPDVRRETIAYDAAGIRLTPDLPPRPVNTPPSAQEAAPPAAAGLRLPGAPQPDETPVIMQGISNDTAGLGRFGHHPDPAFDFCIEVECLQSRLHQAQHGLSKPGTRPETVGAVLADIQRAMLFTVGGDENAVDAKQFLRTLEDQASAPQPAETLAWAVVGEGEGVNLHKLWFERWRASHVARAGERVVRVAIRIVEDEA